MAAFEEIPLAHKTEMILEKYESHKKFLRHNAKSFDVYQGNILKYVDAVMKETLSNDYYSRIKHRIYPLNILRKLVRKLARVYSEDPIRRVEGQENSEILEYYMNNISFNKLMNTADEFSHLFKGYAYKPILRTLPNGEKIPSAKILPYDRFFPIAEDITDPLKVTIFVEIMGNIKVKAKDGTDRESPVLFCFTDTEFMAIDDEGKRLPEFEDETEGTNAAGFIPYYYGNRNQYDIIPVVDSDLLQTSLLIPILYSDLGGAIFFQCFSIMYGIDVDFENISMSPNSFWNLKSDPTTDKSPQVGFIKPQADVEKVLGYIKDIFVNWVDSRDVRAGSIGSLGVNQVASGVSKIIDEMDTMDVVKKAQVSFTADEKLIWDLNRKMHNFWVANGELPGMPILPDNWKVITEFDEPRPIVDRTDELNNVFLEVEKGIMSKLTATKTLHPNWSMDKIVDEQKQILKEEAFDGMDADKTEGTEGT